MADDKAAFLEMEIDEEYHKSFMTWVGIEHARGLSRAYVLKDYAAVLSAKWTRGHCRDFYMECPIGTVLSFQV